MTTSIPGIVGFSNIGNSCYMNTTLQCLMNICEFKNIMLADNFILDLMPNVYREIEQKNKIIDTVDNNNSDKKEVDLKLNNMTHININSCSTIISIIKKTLSYQIKNLIEQVWIMNKLITPTEFKNILDIKIPTFANFSQQDSHELLNFIINTLHEETMTIISPKTDPNSNNIDFIKNKNIKKCIDEFHILPRLFKFLTISSLECPKCGLKKYEFDESMNILSLSIPIDPQIMNKLVKFETKNDKINIENINKLKKILNTISNANYSLDDLLTHFSNIEVLDDNNKWNCDNCKENVNAKRETKIYMPPKILVIHIKRFVHMKVHDTTIRKKSNNLIKFPLILSITNYCDHKETLCNNYNLFAISNHIGSIDNGHYFAYVKSLENNKWYSLNDTHISEITEEKLVTETAYILFYRQN